MYKVDVKNKTLIALTATDFATLGLKERFDIQEWIEKTPSILMYRKNKVCLINCFN